ncbi:uncharacterized protein V1516DRAFT_654985 [Lipomyces oligophaga]|uniref:uncharacterized protein n=1 Tax=Lipomyces oligophaga TaxID=45792 RepID=UPI0034CE7748
MGEPPSSAAGSAAATGGRLGRQQHHHQQQLHHHQPLLRRASIDIASLASGSMRPAFQRQRIPPLVRYDATVADDIIKNQHIYYNLPPDLHSPSQSTLTSHSSVASSTSSSASLSPLAKNRDPSSSSAPRSHRHRSSRRKKVHVDPSTAASSSATAATGTSSSKPFRRRSIDSAALPSTTTDIERSDLDHVQYDLTLPFKFSHILAIMHSMKGVIRGWVKWQTQNNHGAGFCYTEEFSGALCSEHPDGPRILIGDLRGCKVSLSPISATAVQVISGHDPSNFAVLTADSPEEFNKWVAALLTWSPLRGAGIGSKLLRFRYPDFDLPNNSTASASSATATTNDPRPTAKHVATKTANDHTASTGSGEQSTAATAAAAVPSTSSRTIKVGQFEMWDPSWKKPTQPPSKKSKQASISGSIPSSSTLVTPDSINRLWIKASCLLKANGNLEIFPETQPPATNPLFFGRPETINTPNFPHRTAGSSNNIQSQPTQSPSFSNSKSSHFTLQLSTIRRSAIQLAHPSVTEREFSLVIFLKTTVAHSASNSTSSSSTPGSTPGSAGSVGSLGHGPSSLTGVAPSSAHSAFSVHHHHSYHHHQAPSLTENSFPSSLSTIPSAVSVSVLVTPVYLNFDSKTNRDVWFVLLRSLSLPELYGPDTGDAMGSFRQMRTLNIRIIDAKIIMPRGPGLSVDSSYMPKAVDSYVDIEMNDKVRARTKVKYGTTKPFWREDFYFPDLPFLVNSLKLSLRNRNRRLNDFGSDLSIGEVKLLMSDIIQDTDLERWVPVYNASHGYLGKTGEICLKIQVAEYTVLTEQEYSDLLDLLLNFSNHLTIHICNLTGEMKRLSSVFLNIFQATGKATEWLMFLAKHEIWELDGGNGANFSRVQSELTHKEEAGASVPSMTLSPSTRPITVPFSPIGSPTGGNSPMSALLSPPLGGSSNISRIPSRGSIGATIGPSSSAEEMNRSGDNLISPVISRGSSQHQKPMHESTIGTGIGSNFTTKSSALNANLLFRGNSLLTKSLDTHMSRIGHDYLVATLGSVIKKIVDSDIYCEVDPAKIKEGSLLDENWKRLLVYMSLVWENIYKSASRCPPSMRRIFHTIRTNVEEKYGESSALASYSGVSGFLFLRFFCPALLGPKLFGLIHDHPMANAQRTLVLLAKGLQGLANRSTFGAKEPWMEPMNKFVKLHISEVKGFILDVSTRRTTAAATGASIGTHKLGSSVSLGSETGELRASTGTGMDQDDSEKEAMHQSIAMIPYQIPNTVLSRLPTAFKDGVPSLPYLIDRPLMMAELVDVWLTWYDAKVASDAVKQAEADRKRDIEELPPSLSDDSFSGESSAEEDDGDDDQSESDVDDEDISDSESGSETESLQRGRGRDSSRESRQRVHSSGRNSSLESPHVGTKCAVTTPYGVNLDGDLGIFHRECLRIRDEIQRLKYRTSIPEIPSEVPNKTWDYFVANFLDFSQFQFTERREVLKSLLLSSSVESESPVLERTRALSPRKSKESLNADHQYFPVNAAPSSGAGLDPGRSTSPVRFDTNTARSIPSLTSANTSTADSSISSITTSVSRSFGSISKRSKSIRIPNLLKFRSNSTTTATQSNMSAVPQLPPPSTSVPGTPNSTSTTTSNSSSSHLHHSHLHQQE